MAIDVSVQYHGGFSPEIVLTVNPMLLLILISSGNSLNIKCRQEVLSLQSMILPKRFDIFPP